MKLSPVRSLAFATVLFASRLIAADLPSLDQHLEPLRPILDKTLRAQFKASTPDKPLSDVMRWERALNGKAIRIMHSLNDGLYGGESIVFWDNKKQSVTYHYFTTADFRTTGTMTFSDKTITTHEVVEGNANGIAEVRGTFELQSDGSLIVKTEHLQDGKWHPGREAVYKEDPSAKITFK